jgi:hypothetical protein
MCGNLLIDKQKMLKEQTVNVADENINGKYLAWDSGVTQTKNKRLGMLRMYD